MRLVVGLARNKEGEYHFYIDDIPQFKPFLDIDTYPELTVVQHLLMVPRSHYLSAIQHDLMARGVPVPDSHPFSAQQPDTTIDKFNLSPGMRIHHVAAPPLNVLETMKVKLYNHALLQNRNPADITPHANPPSETWADVFDMYDEEDFAEANRLAHVLHIEFTLHSQVWPPF